VDIDTGNTGCWCVNVDWDSLLSERVQKNAYFRTWQTNKTNYNPGETVTFAFEVDTKLTQQTVKVEANLLDSSGNILTGSTSPAFTIYGTQNEPRTFTVTLPNPFASGTYKVEAIAFDSSTNVLPGSMQPATSL